MPRLKTCPACSRHVFVHETRCPFCAGDCSQQARAPIFDIKAGMSRAQRFAVVAAVAGQSALIGCNAIDDPPPETVTVPAYGSPVPPGGILLPPAGSGGSAVAGRGNQAGAGGPVYGAPFVDAGAPQPMYGGGAPLVDAGVAGSGDEDGGTEAGRGGQGGAQPVYGAAIPLYGASPAPEK